LEAGKTGGNLSHALDAETGALCAWTSALGASILHHGELSIAQT